MIHYKKGEIKHKNIVEQKMFIRIFRKISEIKVQKLV